MQWRQRKLKKQEKTLSFSSCSLRVYCGPSWILLLPLSSSSSSWSVAYKEVSLSLICLSVLSPPSWSSSFVFITPLLSPPIVLLLSSNSMFLELDADPIAKDINFMISQKCIKSEHKNVKGRTTCKNLLSWKKEKD